MNHLYRYLLVAVFAIFVGSQITEGALLVPHWQSLSAQDFYSYYEEFGPSIGRFYTILTIVAALIPILLTVFLIISKGNGKAYAIASAVCAVLFLACFYIYFKGTNDLFYQSALSDIDLKSELMTWSRWHWGRVVLEVLSLIFLIVAFRRME